MNPNIFRRVSLARLSSPEQLDHILAVAGPKGWIGLTAAFALLAVTVVWSLEGSIPTTAQGEGVIVRVGGVLNVVSRASGLVVSLKAKVGDKVRAHQVVATLAQPILVEKMKAVREQLADLRSQRERAGHFHEDSSRLQLEALNRQKENNELRIQTLVQQAKLAGDEIPVDEQLLGRGLITKQQLIASRQKLVEIQNDIDSMRAQNTHLDAQAFSLKTQPEQDDEAIRTQIASLERELAGAAKEVSLAEDVVTPYDGEIVEVRAFEGSTVAAGESILSVQPEAKDLELLAYLPSSAAKDAKPGMEVQISPTVVKREEYGFIKGSINYVFSYPATTAAMMRHFENETLVQSLTRSGPVTELRIALGRDSSSPDGLEWSTKHGAPIILSGGTICDVRIVTKRQQPVTLVLPFLRQKTGLM